MSRLVAWSMCSGFQLEVSKRGCREQLNDLNRDLQEEVARRQQAHSDLRKQLDAALCERDRLHDSVSTKDSDVWTQRVRHPLLSIDRYCSTAT